MMKNGDEIKSTLDEYSDVGLGLKMQAEASEFEKTRAFPFNQYLFDSAGNSTRTTPSAAGGRSVGPFFWDMLSSTPGGSMAVSEKSLFTASQLHELGRQQTIHKYMMASIPVPHELLLPISRAPSSLVCAPQSKTSSSGVDSRFSPSKLDPEPWRCRRTDGKKWRCTRNAAAEQRYCERHCHKNRPRSRKHVEPKTSTQSLQASPTSQFPVILGAMPYDQARGIEWCKRGGSSGTAIPAATCDYRQQMQQISSRLDLINRDNTPHQKNVSQSPTLQQQDFKATVPHRFESSHGEYCNPPLPSEMTYFQENYLSLNSNRSTHTPPPHFIDAWEQEGIKGLSPSSLTLSMSSSNQSVETNDIDHRLGVGIDDSERPGGPLGEALRLGNASSSDWLSPNDYSYSSYS